MQKRLLMLTGISLPMLAAAVAGPTMGCGGGSSDDAKFPAVPVTTVEKMRVDQVAFYSDVALQDPDIEVWVMDADADNRVVLCAHHSTGMDKVSTGSVIYGQLGAEFDNLVGTAGELRHFRVRVYHNDAHPCATENESDAIIISSAEKSNDTLLGESDVLNFEDLTHSPIMAENGGFYVRLLATADTKPAAVPLAASLSSGTGNYQVDQLALASTVALPTDATVQLIVTDTAGKLLACAGAGQGMGVVEASGITYGKIFANLVDAQSHTVTKTTLTGQSVIVKIFSGLAKDCPQSLATTPDSKAEIGESAAIVWDAVVGKKISCTNGAATVVMRGK